MYVVSNPADLNGNHSVLASNASHKSPYPWSDLLARPWVPVPGAKHEMNGERGVGVSLESSSVPSGTRNLKQLKPGDESPG